MSLTKCQKCGKELPFKDGKCSHCGVKRDKFGSFLLIAFSILGVFTVASLFIDEDIVDNEIVKLEPKEAVVEKKKIVVRQEKSDIDDSTNVYVKIEADNIVLSGYRKSHPYLMIRCAENTTHAFVNWGLYLGLDETHMLIRLDKERAITTTWDISTNREAVFVRGGDIRFIKNLMNHEKMLAQITPYGENAVKTTFNIKGLSEAIKPLRESCQW